MNESFILSIEHNGYVLRRHGPDRCGFYTAYVFNDVADLNVWLKKNLPAPKYAAVAPVEAKDL